MPALTDLLTNGRVLVTAGAGGAGAAIAAAFANAGARVAVCDIDAVAVERARTARPNGIARMADAGDEAAVGALFDEIEAAWGGIDVLVNNAGVAGPTAAAEDVSLGDWNATLRVNVTGQFLCARRAIPGMKARGGGAIINISSGSAKVGLPLRLPYVVSKAAVLSLTTNLARELGPFGIRANAILPGAIRGERLERVIAQKSAALAVSREAYEADLLRYISMRTMVEADDIAAMAVFLASAGGARVSGQCIGVDGNVEYEA